MGDEYEMGYCSLCGAPTGLREYPGEQGCWLCDACYEAWQRSDYETLLDPALQGVTVTHLRYEMARRRNQLALEILAADPFP